MAALEMGGAVIAARKENMSSPFLEVRRSRSLPRRPRRLHLQAVMTSEPVRSATSFASVDPSSLHRQTSYLSNFNKTWRDNESQLVTQEKLDHWLRDSITEIVRNIGKAPMLVHMFSHGEGSSVRLESEAASSPDIWLRITRRWNEENRMPDGVVLVEELDRGTKEEQTWGLLVQGRGVSCPTCYILSTCRVPSSFGFCTHFCLVRAECFGETAEVQLMRAWSA